jgi:ankyrin repeat protein
VAQGDATAVRALSDMPSAPILWRNQQGDSALTWAVWYGHEAIVEDLLAAGATADVNGVTAKGET